MKPLITLPKIKKGDRITANYLNKIGEISKTGNNLTPSANTRVFAEISRISTSVTITAPLEYEQIDSITFKDSSGEVITLVLKNPPAIP